jgi:SAM-dependent methyltransferase
MTTEADPRSRARAQAQGAVSLAIAYIGIVNDLFEVLHRGGASTSEALAAGAGMDRGYVRRWCDAAYAFGYLDEAGGVFRLTEAGRAMRPGASGTLMPIAVQSMLSTHMAERAAAMMRTGARPGEQVVAECETLMPWFGPMLEANYAGFFADTICPAIPAFREVDSRAGLVVDLGCGNGWYLRVLARRFGALRGLGLDGFAGSIEQASRLAAAEGLDSRLEFRTGDIHALSLSEPADLIAMSRALHHVWEAGPRELLDSLRNNLKPDGAVVIWEPNWPAERGALRAPGAQRLAFQNLTEHVQGNHLLRTDEIGSALREAGLVPQTYLFSDGMDAVVVARRSP